MNEYYIEEQARKNKTPLSMSCLKRWRKNRFSVLEKDLILPFSELELNELKDFYQSIPETRYIKEGSFQGFWPNMEYFLGDRKEKCCVSFCPLKNQLITSYREPLSPIDSEEDFKHTFGIGPREDEVLIGLSSSSVRKGKSSKSSFILVQERESRQLYVFPYRSDTMHHNSIMINDEQVVAAGLIGFDKGKINFISNDSGHFKKEAKTIIDLLDFLNNLTNKRLTAVVSPDFSIQHSLKLFSMKDWSDCHDAKIIKLIQNRLSQSNNLSKKSTSFLP